MKLETRFSMRFGVYNSHDKPSQVSQPCVRLCYTDLNRDISSTTAQFKNYGFFSIVPSIVPQIHMEKFAYVKHCFKYREKLGRKTPDRVGLHSSGGARHVNR